MRRIRSSCAGTHAHEMAASVPRMKVKTQSPSSSVRGVRSASGANGATQNIKLAHSTPANKQHTPISIASWRQSRRTCLGMGVKGEMCMLVHNSTEQFAGCQRPVRTAQHGCTHVVAEIWDKFGTTMGQIYSQSTCMTSQSKKPKWLIHLGFFCDVLVGVRGFEPPASTSRT